MNKKGIAITATITVGLLLAAALVVAVLFGGAAFLVWILAKSLPLLIGVFILVAIGLSYLLKRPIPNKFVMPLLITGIALVVLPMILPALGDITLASVLPWGISNE